MLQSFVAAGVFAAAVVGALLTGLPSPYYVITPGGTWEIGPRLHVPDEQRREMGRLAFTAVYAQPGSWADVLGARVSGAAEVVPAETIRPPGVTQQQVNETNKRQIDESKPVAAVVALRAAGFDVKISGQGAQVSGVIDGMPAQGVLQKDDVIVAADGQPVQTTDDLTQAIRLRKVGEPVRLGVMRGDQRLDLTIETKGAPGEPNRAAVGVYVNTLGYHVDLPFPVEIDSDTVGGPSAGLMFAVGVLDAVTDGDLTRGYFVAGTGTIAADGTVGGVGGAAEKVIAAEHDGAQVFLVPRSDYQEAKRQARSALVEPVDRFEDAVRALCGLPPGAGAPPDPPEVCGRFSS